MEYSENLDCGIFCSLVSLKSKISYFWVYSDKIPYLSLLVKPHTLRATKDAFLCDILCFTLLFFFIFEPNRAHQLG